MVIENGCWVTLRYRLFDLQGEALEDRPRELRYLHGGYGFVFARVESALAGRGVGDHVSITLEPEDHFGDYRAELIALVPIDRLPDQMVVGMSLDCLPGDPAEFGIDAEIHEDYAASVDRAWTVTEMAEGMALLDGNHPLAGMALRFELDVMDIELATAEEIELEAEHGGDGHRPTLH
jgi:FKBP-type peptidyl-prolyl cis-trans isomerase SlyD